MSIDRITNKLYKYTYINYEVCGDFVLYSKYIHKNNTSLTHVTYSFAYSLTHSLQIDR